MRDCYEKNSKAGVYVCDYWVEKGKLSRQTLDDFGRKAELRLKK